MQTGPTQCWSLIKDPLQQNNWATRQILSSSTPHCTPHLHLRLTLTKEPALSRNVQEIHNTIDNSSCGLQGAAQFMHIAHSQYIFLDLGIRLGSFNLKKNNLIFPQFHAVEKCRLSICPCALSAARLMGCISHHVEGPNAVRHPGILGTHHFTFYVLEHAVFFWTFSWVVECRGSFLLVVVK